MVHDSMYATQSGGPLMNQAIPNTGSSWFGMSGPPEMPAPLVERINAEVNRALAAPDVAQQLAAEGALPMPGTPAAFGQLIAREIPRWTQVVKAGNVKAD